MSDLDDVILRQGAAYHEAGHAVMAVCMGGIIGPKGIEATDGAWMCWTRFHFRPDDRSEIRETAGVLLSLAGWRAERKFHRLGKVRDGKDNVRELHYYIAAVRDDSYKDDVEEDGIVDDDTSAILDMLRTDPNLSDDALVERYAAHHRKCMEILDDERTWGAVDVIAKTLLRSGRLSWEEVQRFLGEELLEYLRMTDIRVLDMLMAD
jgi:hypothetical protein